jgi:hypothetical protein
MVLRLHELPRRAQTTTWGLLRVLLLRHKPLPSNPRERKAQWLLRLVNHLNRSFLTLGSWSKGHSIADI